MFLKSKGILFDSFTELDKLSLINLINGITIFNSDNNAIELRKLNTWVKLIDQNETTLSNLNTVGTITTGTWTASTISNTYTQAKVVSVSGTTNRITINGTSNDPIVDISTNYIGQSSITTVGTITTGVWNATVITTTYTQAKVIDITGTVGNIVISGTTTNPTINLQNSIVTPGNYNNIVVDTFGRVTSGSLINYALNINKPDVFNSGTQITGAQIHTYTVVTNGSGAWTLNISGLLLSNVYSVHANTLFNASGVITNERLAIISTVSTTTITGRVVNGKPVALITSATIEYSGANINVYVTIIGK